MFFSYKSMSRTDFLPGTFALHWCFLQPMWKFVASSVDGFLGPMNPWNFTLKCVCVHVCVRARVCPCVACVDGEAPVSFIRLSKASVARRGLRTVHLRTSGSSTELWGLLLTLPLTRDSVALAKYSQPLPSACSVETVSPHGLL